MPEDGKEETVRVWRYRVMLVALPHMPLQVPHHTAGPEFFYGKSARERKEEVNPGDRRADIDRLAGRKERE